MTIPVLHTLPVAFHGLVKHPEQWEKSPVDVYTSATVSALIAQHRHYPLYLALVTPDNLRPLHKALRTLGDACLYLLFGRGSKPVICRSQAEMKGYVGQSRNAKGRLSSYKSAPDKQFVEKIAIIQHVNGAFADPQFRMAVESGIIARLCKDLGMMSTNRIKGMRVDPAHAKVIDHYVDGIRALVQGIAWAAGLPAPRQARPDWSAYPQDWFRLNTLVEGVRGVGYFDPSDPASGRWIVPSGCVMRGEVLDCRAQTPSFLELRNRLVKDGYVRARPDGNLEVVKDIVFRSAHEALTQMLCGSFSTNVYWRRIGDGKRYGEVAAGIVVNGIRAAAGKSAHDRA